MNTTKVPSIVLALLGILFTFVGLLQNDQIMSDKKIFFFGTFVLSGAILFAAAGIAWAISNTGKNSKKESGN